MFNLEEKIRIVSLALGTFIFVLKEIETFFLKLIETHEIKSFHYCLSVYLSVLSVYTRIFQSVCDYTGYLGISIDLI